MILTKEQFFAEKKHYLQCIKEGAVFVYPTDTIYGIGCDATNKTAVALLRKIKHRDTKLLSVIAPGKEWMEKHCVIDDDWLAKLPGAYTLIMYLKDACVAENVTQGLNTVGVRIPDHWIREIVAELGFPIITTSVNKAGEAHMIDLNSLPTAVQEKVAFVLYEGKKDGTPSTLVFLNKEKVEITKR